MTNAMIQPTPVRPRRRHLAGGARIVMLAAVVVAVFISSAAAAFDLADVLFDVNVPPTGMINEKIYGARVVATLTTPEGLPTTDFHNNNILDGTLIGRHGQSLHFIGTRAAFDTFVNQNASRILAILFPSDPESSIQGIPGGASRALDVFNTTLLPPASPSELAASSGPTGRPFAPFEGAIRHQGLALADFERFTIDGTDGSTYKLTPGYIHSIGPLQLGALLPLKYTVLDDASHTTAYTVGLDLHAKYNFTITPGWVVSPLVGGFASVFAFQSDQTDAAGYVRYGGSVGASTKARIGPVFVGFGALYSISTIDIPQSLVSRKEKAIVQALLDRPADQLVTLGGQAEARLFGTNFLGGVGATHIETVGNPASEPGLRSFTQGLVSLGYFRSFQGQRFRADLGYKQIFGADPLRSRGAFLNAVLEF